MRFVRKVANSDVLAHIIDIPEELKNKKVEIIVLPYEDKDEQGYDRKSARGMLEKYKNEKLQDKENGAWAGAVVKKHANS